MTGKPIECQGIDDFEPTANLATNQNIAEFR